MGSACHRQSGLVLVLLVLAAPAAYPQALNMRPRVEITPASVDPGGTVSVDIRYERQQIAPVPDIFRLAGSVTFDPGALTLVSAQPLGGVDFRNCALAVAGRVDFDFAENGCFAPVNPIPEGSFCRLTFSANVVQTTRTARPLGLTLSSCNDQANTICKHGGAALLPKVERTCDAPDSSITVRQALYASTPAPGSTLSIFAPLGGSSSVNVDVRNDGTFSTSVLLSGGGAPVSFSPSGFGLAPSAVQAVSVSCTPTMTSTFQRTITAGFTNDPDRSSASYTVNCTGTLTPERDVQDLSISGNDDSTAPAYDAAGRFVVFQTHATNLATGVQTPLPDSNGGSDILLLDTQTGATQRISVDTNEAEMAGGSIEPSVTADGKQVVFVAPSGAAKELWGESKRMRDRRVKAGGFVMLLRNLITGTTQSVGSMGLTGAGTNPYIAPDSTAIAYTAINTDPAQGFVGRNVYVSELEPQPDGSLLEKPGSPICVSCKTVDAGGAPGEAASGESGAPVLSADGRFLVFETRAKNLLSGSSSPCPSGSEVMLRNLITGATQRMSPPATLANGACGTVGSSKPSVDYSGRKIAFESDSDIGPSTALGFSNVYVVDATTASYTRISEAPDGTAATGASGQVTMSGDGRSVAFVSAATNLDDDFIDSNGQPDVHTRRLDGVGVQRLSLSVVGLQANAAMRRPSLNYNGARVAFDSEAANLVLDDVNEASDVFQRRLPANVDVLHYSGFE